MSDRSTSVLLSPVLWLWMTLVAGSMALVGFGSAQIFLPKPLNVFHTSYLSLAIPQGWHCAQGGTEYVCGRVLSDDPEDRRRAVIIFAAKLRGDHDTLDGYRDHLRSPKSIDEDGLELSHSIVESVKDRVIAGRLWVVGQHLHSEVPNYRTWYFATVAEDLAVLVTYSAHSNFAEEHLADVETVLRNLTLLKPVNHR